ncbi:mid region of cactin-domain-containing protein [Armillaria borealis]|uniref:Splicing factor Cactin n=1 Tax=Armillaria borealis TaxID=47425 RepID=A0AA39N1L3_9AGAR|nr:mid region of cactin-domain-containing protein [Armillaria borealis]
MGRHSSARSPSPIRRYDERDRETERSNRDRKSARTDDRDERDERHKRRRSRSRSKERDDSYDVEKKRIKEEEEARQVAELSVYSATDNPFHDVNLGQQFRWHKKNERDKKAGLTYAESQRRDAVRRQEAKEELERLNRRRAEREADQRLREEEELRMQRLQESAQMSEWLSKEGDFRLEQERKRATIRIQEKRAKAIDFLALNLKYVNPTTEDEDGGEEDAGLEIDLDEPYNIFDNVTDEQVEELHDDIERYLTLEQVPVNIEFWTLDRIKVSNRMGIEAAAAVEVDITACYKLTSGETVDNDYWENLLRRLLVWKAKAKLKSFHEVVVRNRLEQLRKRQRDEALQAQEELLAGVAKSASSKPWIPKDVEADVPVPEDDARDIEEYDRAMSPLLIDITKLSVEDRQIDILTEQEDRRALFEQRKAVAASRFVAKAVQQSGADLASEALYRAEAERELDEEEELFNLEENIPNPTSYNWEDKYRPRKPRYFNRYNQTHYDTDNPPPKVVQATRCFRLVFFNIFYPDLIDKSKAPTSAAFTAGPPYEDIAFRIVNREWEFSHKR